MEIQLRALIFKEQAGGESLFVAQLMPYDFCMQGKTLELLKESIKQTLEGQFLLSSIYNQPPFDQLKSTPEEFFKQYDDGDLIGSMVFKVKTEDTERDIHVTMKMRQLL